MNQITECLPEGIYHTQTFVCASLRLNVLDFTDISMSEHEKAAASSTSKRSICVEDEGDAHHRSSDTSPAFKLLVADEMGSRALAFELERRLDAKNLVGKQLVLSGEVNVFNGIILLDSKNCCYLDEEACNLANKPIYDFEIPSDGMFSEP